MLQSAGMILSAAKENEAKWRARVVGRSEKP